MQRAEWDKKKGKYIIPRIPGEDYQGVVLLTELARLLGIDAVVLNKMRSLFESLPYPMDLDFKEIRKKMKKLAGRIFKSSVLSKKHMNKPKISIVSNLNSIARDYFYRYWDFGRIPGVLQMETNVSKVIRKPQPIEEKVISLLKLSEFHVESSSGSVSSAEWMNSLRKNIIRKLNRKEKLKFIYRVCGNKDLSTMSSPEINISEVLNIIFIRFFANVLDE